MPEVEYRGLFQKKEPPEAIIALRKMKGEPPPSDQELNEARVVMAFAIKDEKNPGKELLRFIPVENFDNLNPQFQTKAAEHIDEINAKLEKLEPQPDGWFSNIPRVQSDGTLPPAQGPTAALKARTQNPRFFN
ncbi:MAG TPA: hypothetical protein VHB73_06285 [Alphaproteobacteria bacterium]|nr:hypothetical protein [Alphaproteobacteria bacterium]